MHRCPALGTYAWNRRGAAIRNADVARASQLDTQAAAFFDESRLWDARREIEVNRRLDLLERLNQPDLGATRQDNRMYFVNREGRALTVGRQEPADADETPDDVPEEAPSDDPHGARLDEFFKAEQPFNPNYRRIFRSASGGSVIIDLPIRCAIECW